MKEDVRQQRSHEEKRCRAGILDADYARFMRAAKVTGDDLQSSSGRTVVVARIEWNDERRVRLLVHAEHEMLADRRLRERHPLLGDTTKDNAWIGRGIDVLKIADARGQSNVAVHRCVEEGLLGVEMAQNGRRRHPQLGGDIGERRGREALLCEDLAGRLQDLIFMDEWWPPHL